MWGVLNLFSRGSLPQAFAHVRHEPSNAVEILPLAGVALPFDVRLQQFERLVAVLAVCYLRDMRKTSQALENFACECISKTLAGSASDVTGLGDEVATCVDGVYLLLKRWASLGR